MHLLRSTDEAIARRDPYYQAQLAVLVALGLQFVLPDRIAVGPFWLIPSLEGVLLVGLVLSTPRSGAPQSPARRSAAVFLIALVSLANLVSLALLVHYLLQGGKAGGHALILAGMEIWLTNAIIFGLWFWELDRGGPWGRANEDPEKPVQPDFLFPQMAEPRHAPGDWRPNFIDYLYTSLTNATAFSPTDTMPLSQWAKVLMGVQSLVSLVTIGIVAARAVNILT